MEAVAHSQVSGNFHVYSFRCLSCTFMFPRVSLTSEGVPRCQSMFTVLELFLKGRLFRSVFFRGSLVLSQQLRLAARRSESVAGKRRGRTSFEAISRAVSLRQAVMADPERKANRGHRWKRLAAGAPLEMMGIPRALGGVERPGSHLQDQKGRISS